MLLQQEYFKMSFFTKIFGGKKDDDGPTPAQAIQKLRETEDMLIKKQEFLEKKIENETALARKNASSNKRIAIQALKRKKRYEKQLQQIDGTLTTIELQRQTLEDASTSGQVLSTMKNAADAIKIAHKNMYVKNYLKSTFIFTTHEVYKRIICGLLFLVIYIHFLQYTWVTI